jgi:hypothetical protein
MRLDSFNVLRTTNLYINAAARNYYKKKYWTFKIHPYVVAVCVCITTLISLFFIFLQFGPFVESAVPRTRVPGIAIRPQ